MAKTKEKPEFVRERVNGKKLAYVKRLAFGGEIHRDKSGEYSVYRDGAYLGYTNNQTEAEYMAIQGFTNCPGTDPASELCLWPLWNEVVAAGHRVLLADDGEQLVALPNSMYLLARKDAEFGWEVELLSDVEVNERYGDTEFDCVHHLKPIGKDKAFKVE